VRLASDFLDQLLAISALTGYDFPMSSARSGENLQAFREPVILSKGDGNMATPAPRSYTAYCPECDTKITFKKEPELGQRVTCRECSEILEVVELDPLELDWAYEEDDEEWDDWEDEDDEDW
jgi:lysine biosynthesis protein LysW